MNTSIKKPRTLQIVVPLALLFLAALLIETAANAHEVIGPDGKPTHTHVYKKAPYGNGVIAGHVARPAGSNGIVIWQAAPEQSYRQAQPGMRISNDPWSKKNPQLNQKKIYRQKPVFTKEQSRTPDLKPQ